MHTLTLSVSEDAIDHLNHWLEVLYLTGNLTGDDPARACAALIVRAFLTDMPELTIRREDLTN